MSDVALSRAGSFSPIARDAELSSLKKLKSQRPPMPNSDGDSVIPTETFSTLQAGTH